MLNNLKNFEAVWKRVSGNYTPPEKKPAFKLMPGKEKSGYAIRFAPYNK